MSKYSDKTWWFQEPEGLVNWIWNLSSADWLQLLYPLEIHEAETPEAGSEDAPASISDVRISAPVEKRDAPTPREPERRPMRATAKRANEKIRAWTQELQDWPNGNSEFNLSKYTVKDSNNSFIVIFMANFEFCTHLSWPRLVNGGRMLELSWLSNCNFGSRDQTHAFVKLIDGLLKCLTNLPLYLVEQLALNKTIGTKKTVFNKDMGSGFLCN